MKQIIRVCGLVMLLSLGSWLGVQAAQVESPHFFQWPDDAVKALLAATQNHNRASLHEIFGPSIDQMLTGDPAQDAANFQSFAEAVRQYCAPVTGGPDKVTLEMGSEHWPFPIPLVHANGGWFFDTNAGKQEIICRHIGRDELHAIALCRASAKNEQPPASRQIYGYQFKVLTRQGGAAPGGKRNYLVDGKSAQGFALLAYPVSWGRSGIMTFIVGPDGRVYQRDLGEGTARTASKINAYNPTSQWKLVDESGVLD